MPWLLGDDDKYPESGIREILRHVHAMKFTASETTTRTKRSGTTSLIPGIFAYLTISEICDHRHIEDAWIIEPDNDFGFDVYDISGRQ